MRKKQIGVVGVDSGQVLICDPCYIDSQWVQEGFSDIRLTELNYQGKRVVIDMAKMIEAGIKYDTPWEIYGGKTMNEMLHEGIARDIPKLPTHRFSYDGCCRVTSSKDGGGQLNYERGHPGVGVACSTGYGDGEYPVIAHYDEEGRVRKIEILFD